MFSQEEHSKRIHCCDHTIQYIYKNHNAARDFNIILKSLLFQFAFL